MPISPGLREPALQLLLLYIICNFILEFFQTEYDLFDTSRIGLSNLCISKWVNSAYKKQSYFNLIHLYLYMHYFSLHPLQNFLVETEANYVESLPERLFSYMFENHKSKNSILQNTGIIVLNMQIVPCKSDIYVRSLRS